MDRGGLELISLITFIIACSLVYECTIYCDLAAYTSINEQLVALNKAAGATYSPVAFQLGNFAFFEHVYFAIEIASTRTTENVQSTSSLHCVM